MRTTKLAPVQIMTIITSAMLGSKILMTQQDLVTTAKQDGWVSVLLAGLIVFFTVMAFLYPLARTYPDMDFPEMLLKLFGRTVGRIVLIPALLYVLMETGTSVRVFVHLVKLFLLDRTPEFVLVILFVLAVLSVSKRDIKAIGASIDFMFPIYLFPLIVLILLSITQVEMENIQPVLFRNTANVIKGSIPALGTMTGSGAVLYFVCYAISPKDSKKWVVAGVLISIIVYAALTLMTILVFGPEEIKYMVFPGLTLSKAIEFPVTLLERLESLTLIIWIPAVFAGLVIFSHMSIRNLIVLLSLKEKHKKYLVFGHIPLLSVIALLPANFFITQTYVNVLNYMDLGLLFGLPPLMLVVSKIKRRRKK